MSLQSQHNSRRSRGLRRKLALGRSSNYKSRLLLEPLEERVLLTVNLLGSPVWTEQGPSVISGGNNIENIPGNPQNGAINVFAPDPTNVDRAFVAAANGGIWRTSNATAASPIWTPLTDQFASLSIGDVEFSPLDPSNNTLYAGTGKFSSGFGDGGSQGQLLRTTDGGSTWSLLSPSSLAGRTIGRVIPTDISTGTGQVILAGTTSGIFRSVDGGLTFAPAATLSGPTTDLVADTSDPMRFYAAQPGPGKGVFISNDGGQTWNPDNGNIPAAIITQSQFIELAVHPSGTNSVFAVVYGQSGATPTINALRSINQGGTWTPMATPPPNGIPRLISIAADPNDSNVVFIAGTPNDPTGPNPWGANRPSGRIFRGDAGQPAGSQWTPVFSNGTTDGSSPHPDSRDLAFDAAGNLINTNDGGIYKLLNPDTPASRHWVDMLGTLRVTEFYSVAWDSVNDTVFGGSQDNGSPQQLASGAFPAQDRTGADGTVAQVDNTSNPGHSIHYGAEQNLGQFTFRRQTFDNTNTPAAAVEIGENIAGTAGLKLSDKDAQGNFTFDTTITFIQAYKLNAVDPTRMIIGTNFLYESFNQGDTLTSLGGLNAGNTAPINPVGAVNPSAHGTTSYNPIAYGGFSLGVPNADVLWVGAGGKLLLRTNGSGLPTNVAAYPGATVLGVAMDPNDWHTAFVLDANGHIFKTSNTGANWTDLTGNLSTFTTDLRTIAVVRGGAGLSVVVGGQDGVYRAINPSGSPTWTRLGANFPNAVVHDLQYNATDNVLVAGTFGRGALTLANANTVIFAAGVLSITGDTDFPGEDDTIELVRDAANPLLLDVFLNGTMSGPYPLASMQQINVDGLAGNDTLILDSSNGLISVPKGIRYDGGTGFDAVQLVQTGGGTQASDVYAVGPTIGSGSSIITGPTGTQSLSFQNLEPMLDVVPAATLTVNATNADNAINYMQGSTAANGLVTVDDQESIEFSNKDNLILNGLAGSDTINIDNSAVPDGATPGGLKTVQVNGGDPTGSDTVVVTAVAGVSDQLRVQPTTQGAGTVTYTAPHPLVGYLNIEHLTLVGQAAEGDSFRVDGTAGNDAFTYNVGAAPDSGTVTGMLNQNPAGFPLVPIAFSGMSQQTAREFNAVAGGIDRLTFVATDNDDSLLLVQSPGPAILIGESIGVQPFGSVRASNMEIITVNAGSGNDTVTFDAGGNATTSPPTIRLEGGDSDNLSDTLTFAANASQVTQVDLGTSLITSGGADDVHFAGFEKISINDSGGALTVVGTAAQDNLVYTPTGPQAGKFQLADGGPLFNFFNLGASLFYFGGTGDETDLLTVQGTSARDTFTIDAVARTARVNSFALVTLDGSVETLTALGLAGDDTFNVVPGSLVAPPGGIDNLVINIDGGDPQASDALVVSGPGGATLLANQFAVVNRGRDPNSGVVRVYTDAVPLPDVTYRNVETVSVNASGTNVLPNLLLLGPDAYEPNENLGNAAFLGSAPSLQVEHASIFPNSSENPPVPADQDYYRVVVGQTGVLDFQVYFRLFHTGLLPLGGNLNVQVLDTLGNVIGMASAGAAGFGALGGTGNARVRIPVVAGQSYYVRIFGANAFFPPGTDHPPGGTPNASVVNGYDMTVINTPAPQPFNLQLSRSVGPGVAGNPDTGDVPTDALNSDSGRSQFDNVTKSNTPTIFIRLNDGNLLNDLQGNGTAFPNNPPAGVIPIPFTPSANTAGFRVAIFDGNDSQNPVPIGFATPVNPATFPGLYTFTFTTPLADGLHHINAAVQMVDPQTVKQTGFGAFSLHSLDIIVDKAVPPVFFGLAGSATDGLDPPSDSGVTPNSPTFIDRITNVTAPTFFGTAEANSIIRMFATIGGEAAPVLIGQTVAIPLDGTNAFPNGRWTLKSNVDLNDPSLFPRDGLRRITVTAEDLAGNVSGTQQLDIFIDTQGPQITNVEITDHPGFNLFGLKPNNAYQGPTPLVTSLTIRLQDLPANDALFLRNAIDAGVASTPGLITVRGDHNGIVAIVSTVVINDPPIAGQASTASIELTLAEPLPDDRFTLTVSDTIVDLAGNHLDGENNAIQPVGFPLFPTGDGQPGGTFVARFTVDSRPEIATYAAANIAVDANGNFLWDPQGQDNDFTNRDLTFGLGIVPSLQGIVSPMGIHDGVFAGNFPALSRREELGALSVGIQQALPVADGFDKLAAYGYDSTAKAFRWLIDTNNDGIIDPAAGDFATIQPAGFQINGLPVAGDFDGVALNGAEIGLFDGTKWYFDTNHNHVIDGGDLVSPTNLRGVPIVGDFNGDGTLDLATWKDDVFYFNFGTRPGGPGTQPAWSGAVDATIHWGLPGNAELPVAADMDQDGITDIGLFLPSRSSTLPLSSGNWQFLVSNDFNEEFRGGKQVSALNHPFTPTPLGHDLFAQFGDAFALPIVGNFDPPVGPVAMPTPTGLAALLGSLTMGTQTINGEQWYSFTPLRSGTISVDASQTGSGAALSVNLYDVDYNLMGSSSATAVAHVKLSHSVEADHAYLLRLKGTNATADVNLSNQVADADRLDTTRDSLISAVDALRVINELNAFGTHATPLLSGNAKLYYDTNLDGKISPLDVLQVINYLISKAAASSGFSAGPQAAISAEPQGATSAATATDDVAFGLSLASAPAPAAASSVTPVPADTVYAQLAAAPAARSPLAVVPESAASTGGSAQQKAVEEVLLADPDRDWL